MSALPRKNSSCSKTAHSDTKSVVSGGLEGTDSDYFGLCSDFSTPESLEEEEPTRQTSTSLELTATQVAKLATMHKIEILCGHKQIELDRII